MRFDDEVLQADRDRIAKALDDIEEYGDQFHVRLARFILASGINIHVGDTRGSGSVSLSSQSDARRAVGTGTLEPFDAAQYVRLNIARGTIDTGGQRGIEGTLVHEGKHALDFSYMLASFSKGNEPAIFNPTAYQREYSAHLTSALYLMRRGGEYADEGVSLGLLKRESGTCSVNVDGIRNRLRNNYGLTPGTPGKTLDHCSWPKIKTPSRMWFGMF